MSRPIPDPGFAGDDGRADPALRGLLASYAAGEVDRVEVLAVLTTARLLVPVVAVVGEVEADERGLVREKNSDMAVVLLTRPNGRRGLLAFTGMETLTGWDPAARPVPVTARAAAAAALQEGADALVIDVAGPTRVVVDAEDLQGLAAGWRLTRLDAGQDGHPCSAWIRPSAH